MCILSTPDSNIVLAHIKSNQIKSNHFYCHITTAQVPWWVKFLWACSRQCKKTTNNLHMDRQCKKTTNNLPMDRQCKKTTNNLHMDRQCKKTTNNLPMDRQCKKTTNNKHIWPVWNPCGPDVGQHCLLSGTVSALNSIENYDYHI